MSSFRRWLSRVKGLFGRRRAEEELADEIASHLEIAIDENVRQGMNSADAERQARLQLGGEDIVKEAYRDQRSIPVAEILLQDIRYGLRSLRKSPGFTLAAVLTLGLGIGANTAIFSVVDSVLIKSLPFRNAGQLLDLAEINPLGQRNSVSGGAFKDWVAGDSLLSGAAIYAPIALNLTGSGLPQRVSGLEVTSEYLGIFDIRPALGADFAADVDKPSGNSKVVILSNALWRSRFGADPSWVGKAISLDGVPYLVMGILPEHALLDSRVQFLVPCVIGSYTDARWTRSNGAWWAAVVARAKPGVTAAQVDSEIKAIRTRLSSEYPVTSKDWGVSALPLQETLTTDSRPTLVMLFCTVTLILLIACVNVANLLLARGSSRSHEMAIRGALGAHSRRLACQMMTESALLAVAGCILGLFLAFVGINLARTAFAGIYPPAVNLSLDGRVLSFTVVTTVFCALLFGVLPSLRGSRPDLNVSLKDSDRGSSSGRGMRAQSTLVVAEVALTLVLLTCAGLSIDGFLKLRSTNLGFNPHRTLAFNLSFPMANFPNADARKRFMRDLEPRLGAIPGVQAEGFSSTLPLSGAGFGEALTLLGKPWDGKYYVGADMVSTGYFASMGIPILRGRSFTESEFNANVPAVCVISDGVVKDLFGGQDPVGRQVVFWGATMTVIGVVPDDCHLGLIGAPRSAIYLPGMFPTWQEVGIVVRSAISPAALTSAVRDTVASVNSNLPIANIRVLDDAVDDALAPWKMTLLLTLLFAGIAVGLAAVGLYGVISYSVTQRRQELGIRMALGAERGRILWIVLGRTIWLTFAGTLCGAAIALAAGGLLSTQVFGVEPRNFAITACSTAVMVFIAVLGALIPAIRATRLNPVAILRNE